MEFKNRNISFVRFLNLAFKFTLRRMKMNENPRRISAEIAYCIVHGAGKTEPYWLQKCGFKDRESLERRSSAFISLRRARIKRRNKNLNKRGLMFFDTKYDEKKIASFNQMNTLLRCVLLFFILGAGRRCICPTPRCYRLAQRICRP